MTELMAILNITPNSYYQTGQWNSPDLAVQRIAQLLEEGADLIDIGAESTNPGCEYLTLEEEKARFLPLFDHPNFGTFRFSVDTRKTEIAEMAYQRGCRFINDISGGESSEMRHWIADHSDVLFCVMHMQGTPQTMQLNPTYPHGIVDDVLRWFEARIALLESDGVRRSQLYIDPGICFGKSVEDNFELLRQIDRFRVFGCPLLLGTSRKSFLRKTVECTVDECLPATLAVNTWLAERGIEILRVHDVAPHRQLLAVVRALKA